MPTGSLASARSIVFSKRPLIEFKDCALVSCTVNVFSVTDPTKKKFPVVIPVGVLPVILTGSLG